MRLRAQSILRAQQAATTKLEQQQAATKKQIGAVSTDVASVKTDVGGVKTDVATTKSDLEATKTQLNRVMGDAGVMSGLIATNHGELEILKHKGDRNYFEFTLQKGAKPTLLSTIKLQLKKVDMKHSRYTLNVSADDRNIEKKDKGLDEPVQFYTGKTPVLYELVVNDIEKNKRVGISVDAEGHGRRAVATLRAADAERGTLIASPVSVCLGWIYFFFAAFFAGFLAAFLAAFFVAICLFSLLIRHRSATRCIAANEGIDLRKFTVKKNRYVS